MDILQNALKALVGQETIYFALLAVGLGVQFGYAGLLNFGQVGFALLGAYGVAVSVNTWGFSYWIGVLVGLAAAAALALILGATTLRLRADYLAIVTIAAAEILRLGFRTPGATDVTGGTQGLQGFSGAFYDLSPFPLTERYRPLGILFTGQELWALLVGWFLVGLAVLILWLYGRSPGGRVLKAIREDEDAARALGKNVVAHKMRALLLGGLFAAMAGIFQATATRNVDPDIFLASVTFFAYAALILGGASRAAGGALGAMLLFGILSVTDSVLRQFTDGSDPLISPDVLTPQVIAATRFVLVGIALILLIAFRPQGILGNRTEVRLHAR